MRCLIERLARVRTLKFEAATAEPNGWNGIGSGTVDVEQIEEWIIVFHETGRWVQASTNREFDFSNSYRWTGVHETSSVRLEHLRFGTDNPVFLFDLIQISTSAWESGTPHQCSEDQYNATLGFDDDKMTFDWSICGPSKDQSIRYTYL